MFIRSIILTGMLCVSLSGQFAQAWTNTATVSALGAMSAASLGQTCPCHGDVDNSGLIQLQDILIVIDCTNGIEPDLPLTCEAADINCDGVTDFCDASRVYCQWIGQTNCCDNTVCGACCNSGAFYNSPCLVVSEDFCLSPIIEEGEYRGDGTTCDPSPCGSPECTTDADCNDQNICTDDVCTGGVCVQENVAYGTPCPDEIFCNGDETCQFGVCQSGPSRTCDDGLSCTFDTCNITEDVCINTPDACNNDGVCDSPCESKENCPGDCSVCDCVLDQDGSGFINLTDLLNVAICAEGGTPLPPKTCDSADLNCDGVIDYCDVSVVYCAFFGGTDCCDVDIVCGACCNSGANFNHTCLVASQQFCLSALIVEGEYRGDGTTCDPDPCDTPPPPDCLTDADCNDLNVCTDDVCTGGICVHENVAYGTPCSDEIFCNGDETCQFGVCQSGPSRTCDDGLSCTFDTCNIAEDVCVNTPDACNNDGVCDFPCETMDNCPADCTSCTCLLDQDNSGELIRIQDILNVMGCAESGTPGSGLSCDTADLNCDGVIDFCDASRVVHAWLGGANSCTAEMECGACSHTSSFGGPCTVMSELFCTSVLIENGVFHGVGTTSCDPPSCNTPQCTLDSDCDDVNPCTTDACTIDCQCENFPVTDFTDCPDDSLFCNGDEKCFSGICQSPGAPRNCSDSSSCTIDSCNEELDICEHSAPAECNNDGVCDAPCETSSNCPGDCGDCVCVLDQEGNGTVNIGDVLNVMTCAEGGIPTDPFTCNNADLDCDGDIDFCDVSRVVCAWFGRANCCEAEIPCGACCNDGSNWGHTCFEISAEFCNSNLVGDGIYLGDGTTCEPYPCDNTPCSTDAECFDDNACTTDMCSLGGICEYTPVENGTSCSDELYCNGDETCQSGVCQAGALRSCDDLNPCTIDDCNNFENSCVNTPVECNYDGVCDAPCENADNCLADCSSCTAIRDLSGGSMAYCSGVVKTVRINLNVPSGALAGAVEDTPPTGWIQINNISNGGAYDAANHKVKWGPFFAPFPTELTYDVLPPVEAVGLMCFSGSTVFDNDPAETICGDECIEDSCCPDLPADEAQPVCIGCSDNCSATYGDGRVELCEVIRYACGWKRGCNDDITGVTGGAYIWMVSECFCWDEGGMSWIPESCSPSSSGCCDTNGQSNGSIAMAPMGAVTVSLDATRHQAYSENNRRFVNPKLRESMITVSINPPYGTSAVALELQIPKGMVMNTVSDGGAWDPLHRKVKWGPFFSDQPQTVTVTVSGSVRREQDHGLTGTISYDGKNYPIKLGLNDQ